jgi:hypothetical protein
MGAYDELDKFQTEEGRKVVSAFVAEALADEQQPAEATGGEQAQDGAAADADPYDWDPVYAAATIAELQKQLAAANARAESATVLPERWRALIAERDEAVRRAEAAKARLAELGAPEVEYGLQYGNADPQALRAQDEIAYYQRQRHSGLRVRDVYRSQWCLAPETGCRSCGETDRVAGDPPLCSNCAVYGPTYRGVACWPPIAAPDGRSATLRAEDGVQASGSELEFGSGTAGLSEPEPCDGDCDCECQPGQPCLCPERDCYCGPCRVCGDNPQQPNDDTTEDDRG